MKLLDLKLEDVRRQFNKYKLSDMLHRLYELSVRIQISDDATVAFNVKRIVYNCLVAPKKEKKYSYILSNWNILDVAYFICKYDSDSFTKREFDENDFLKIIGDYITHSPTQYYKSSDDILLYLYGFGGEQFNFQTPTRIIDNYSRENYILSNYYDIEVMNDITRKTIGVSIKELSSILLYLYMVSLVTKDVLNVTFNFGNITQDDISKVVKHYSVRIEDIKESKLKRQLFYTKPFIEESTGGIFPVNSYLIYHIFMNSSLWTIRDYFNGVNSNEFINLFGTMFENYVEHLFDRYIGPENTHRIPRIMNRKSADYYLTLGDYKIVVEAKSGLLGLNARQQESNIEIIKKYINENLIVAIHQLSESEKVISHDKCIKIILTYEDYFKSELLDEVFKTDADIVDDRLFWLVNISEFENLLYLFQNDNKVFCEIIEEKIKCEAEKSPHGRDVAQLLHRKGIKKNLHINQTEYRSYYDEIDRFIKNNLKDKR